MWANIKERWPRFVGVLLLLPWVVQIIDWLRRIDFILSHAAELKAIWALILNPAYLFVLTVLGLALIWWDARRPHPKAAASAASATPIIVQLTPDQLLFRANLKQFALTWPNRIHDEAARVRAVIVNKIKKSGDQPHSYALHHAMHFAWSATPKSLERIKELASVELERIEIGPLQHALRVFLDDYLWEQRSIANLNVMTKIDLASMPETKHWLEADKEFWAEMTKLKVWSEAAANFKNMSGTQMASNTANWTEPFRVNF